MSRIETLLVLSIACACGGSSPPPPAPAEEPVAEAAPSPPPPPATQGQIARASLLPVLEGGLGRFLQGVETEPMLERGRFVGFRLVTLYPEDERFTSIDLRPGDVVTRVNGQPIERPEQAIQVWNGLRVASELMIEYLREGQPRELRFEIVD